MMNPSNGTLQNNSLDAPVLTYAIDAEIHGYIAIVLNLILNPILGLTGILLNIFNMIVFYKMGLSDGVTQNFFMLAVSDALLATASFVNKMAHLSRTIIRAYIGYEGMEQSAQILYSASFYSITLPQVYSLLITVVIAVVRCCCVSLPLKVKYLLTARRQLATILVLSGISTCIYVYVVAPVNMFIIRNPATNSTIAYFEGGRWSILAVFTNIISFGGFTICITCVIILSNSLRESSKFRDTSTASTSTSANNSEASTLDGKSNEKQRNQRVIKTVILVSVIFIVCKVPNMMYYILKASLEQ